MPGYILHLTAAQMYLKSGQSRMNQKQKNNFLIGNLLPDTTKQKEQSHFRNPKFSEYMVEYPETEWFIQKYKKRLKNSCYLGYLFHLYIDRKFFKEYLPQIVEFRNQKDEVAVRRKEVSYVYLKRTGEKILKEDFFSEKYYYGDYTKMNTWLVNHYQIPMELSIDIPDPGIEEVHYKDIENVLRELHCYLKVSEDAVKQVKVFEIKHLLAFLKKAVKEFSVPVNIDCIAIENIIK